MQNDDQFGDPHKISGACLINKLSLEDMETHVFRSDEDCILSSSNHSAVIFCVTSCERLITFTVLKRHCSIPTS